MPVVNHPDAISKDLLAACVRAVRDGHGSSRNIAKAIGKSYRWTNLGLKACVQLGHLIVRRLGRTNFYSIAIGARKQGRGPEETRPSALPPNWQISIQNHVADRPEDPVRLDDMRTVLQIDAQRWSRVVILRVSEHLKELGYRRERRRTRDFNGYVYLPPPSLPRTVGDAVNRIAAAVATVVPPDPPPRTELSASDLVRISALLTRLDTPAVRVALGRTPLVSDVLSRVVEAGIAALEKDLQA